MSIWWIVSGSSVWEKGALFFDLLTTGRVGHGGMPAGDPPARVPSMIALGSDHVGFELKEPLEAHFEGVHHSNRVRMIGEIEREGNE